MKKTAVLAIGIFLLVSCAKEDSGVPDIYVNYRFLDVEYESKRDENGLFMVSGQGVAGLMIYRISSGNYVAFDRCSTVNPGQKCAVKAEEGSAFTVIDPCSGAKFSVIDGAPAKAPAKKALKKYNVSPAVGGGYTVIN